MLLISFSNCWELILDCQSLNLPDDSFRIMVLHLLLESKNSRTLEEEVRELIGIDPASYEEAKEHLENRQCIAKSLNKEKTGRKGNMMAGKRNVSGVPQLTPNQVSFLPEMGFSALACGGTTQVY